MNPVQSAYAAFRSGSSLEISKSKSVLDLKKAAQTARSKLDPLFAQGLKATSSTVACCAGCAYCCYLKVDVHAHEIFSIVDYLRRNKSVVEIEAIASAAEANKKKVRPMTEQEQLGTNIRCPLLNQDNTCSVYPVRPALCRSKHSVSVQPCKESFDDPQDLESPSGDVPEIKMVLSGAIKGINDSWSEAGYDDRAYDLNGALLEALSSLRPESRWRDKKKAFTDSALEKGSKDS